MYYRSSICITDPVSTCNYLSVSVLAVEKIMYQHVKVLQSVSVLKTFGCVLCVVTCLSEFCHATY